MCMCMYIYIYIHISLAAGRPDAVVTFRRGDDAVGNPRRAQISQFQLRTRFSQFEPFELILLLKLDKRFPVEQFEATVSQSTVPSPLLMMGLDSSGTLAYDRANLCLPFGARGRSRRS